MLQSMGWQRVAHNLVNGQQQQQTPEHLFSKCPHSANPLQYSCLENPMDRGAWWATVHGVAELDMTKRLNTHAHTLGQAPRVQLLSFKSWQSERGRKGRPHMYPEDGDTQKGRGPPKSMVPWRLLSRGEQTEGLIWPWKVSSGFNKPGWRPGK